MTKRNRIIYWVATNWLSLGMVSTAIVQLLGVDEELVAFTHLGYPSYLLSILGVWKILGVIAILVPKFGVLKEWAYAGFFFAMSGAAISHIMVKDAITEILPSLLLLTLTIISWYFRPASRRVV
jgi:uncharacterized membrane protein